MSDSPTTAPPKPASTFDTLSLIDVSRHIEKKGGFSYLSWPYAVAQLRAHCPDATWRVLRFEGLPFLVTECGVFVEVAVTVAAVELSQIHPVLDARNKPIAKPTAFDINTSIQRALVKAIALHGLGLYIYAGEDLPTLTAEPPSPEAVKVPDGYTDALDGLRDVATEGEAALRAAWANVPKDIRDHVTTHDVATWQKIKDSAKPKPVSA